MNRQIQLSKRMQAVVELVTKGKRVADIGCDHAYVSIYLIEQKIATSVIAMDINKGPLERAKENIKKQGLQEYIETRLSNGMKALQPGEVDTLLIAGMGGPLMQQILSGNPAVFEQVEELVLQPQSEIGAFRAFIKKIGFTIVEENMVLDEGKYYAMMRAKRADAEEIKEKEVYNRYGRLLLTQKHPVLLEYLKKELKQYGEIKEKLLQHQTEKTKEKLKELEENITYCEEALGYYEG